MFIHVYTSKCYISKGNIDFYADIPYGLLQLRKCCSVGYRETFVVIGPFVSNGCADSSIHGINASLGLVDLY